MQCLVDGDIVAYRCAASCEKQGEVVDPLEIGISRTDELMHRIIHETGSTSYRIFLSAGENYRHQIYPAYKANRASLRRPEYLQVIREHLITAWNAELSIGIEADDSLGIAQIESTIICSIDKDLLQVPGRHYNFVKNEFYNVDLRGGRLSFWMQMIMGDRADNIPGYDGKMRQKIPQFLAPLVTDLEACETEEEMHTLVKDVYENKEQFEINKILFHILREPYIQEEIPGWGEEEGTFRKSVEKRW